LNKNPGIEVEIKEHMKNENILYYNYLYLLFFDVLYSTSSNLEFLWKVTHPKSREK